MSAPQLIESTYDGHPYHFNSDGWFSATEAAEKYGKRPVDWLKQGQTKKYLAALMSPDKVSENHFIRTRKGKGTAGTWFHPALSVTFARWLSVDFSIWCDKQIREIISGTHAHYDWERARHEASATFKVMNKVLKMTREQVGKESKPYHFSNESRLINGVMTGVFSARDRNAVPLDELNAVGHLELENTVMIAQGVNYPERKERLQQVYMKSRNLPVMAREMQS